MNEAVKQQVLALMSDLKIPVTGAVVGGAIEFKVNRYDVTLEWDDPTWTLTVFGRGRKQPPTWECQTMFGTGDGEDIDEAVKSEDDSPDLADRVEEIASWTAEFLCMLKGVPPCKSKN